MPPKKKQVTPEGTQKVIDEKRRASLSAILLGRNSDDDNAQPLTPKDAIVAESQLLLKKLLVARGKTLAKTKTLNVDTVETIPRSLLLLTGPQATAIVTDAAATLEIENNNSENNAKSLIILVSKLEQIKSVDDFARIILDSFEKWKKLDFANVAFSPELSLDAILQWEKNLKSIISKPKTLEKELSKLLNEIAFKAPLQIIIPNGSLNKTASSWLHKLLTTTEQSPIHFLIGMESERLTDSQQQIFDLTENFSKNHFYFKVHINTINNLSVDETTASPVPSIVSSQYELAMQKLKSDASFSEIYYWAMIYYVESADKWESHELRNFSWLLLDKIKMNRKALTNTGLDYTTELYKLHMVLLKNKTPENSEKIVEDALEFSKTKKFKKLSREDQLKLYTELCVDVDLKEIKEIVKKVIKLYPELPKVNTDIIKNNARFVSENERIVEVLRKFMIHKNNANYIPDSNVNKFFSIAIAQLALKKEMTMAVRYCNMMCAHLINDLENSHNYPPSLIAFLTMQDAAMKATGRELPELNKPELYKERTEILQTKEKQLEILIDLNLQRYADLEMKRELKTVEKTTPPQEIKNKNENETQRDEAAEEREFAIAEEGVKAIAQGASYWLLLIRPLMESGITERDIDSTFDILQKSENNSFIDNSVPGIMMNLAPLVYDDALKLYKKVKVIFELAQQKEGPISRYNSSPMIALISSLLFPLSLLRVNVENVKVLYPGYVKSIWKFVTSNKDSKEVLSKINFYLEEKYKIVFSENSNPSLEEIYEKIAQLPQYMQAYIIVTLLDNDNALAHMISSRIYLSAINKDFTTAEFLSELAVKLNLWDKREKFPYVLELNMRIALAAALFERSTGQKSAQRNFIGTPSAVKESIMEWWNGFVTVAAANIGPLYNSKYWKNAVQLAPLAKLFQVAVCYIEKGSKVGDEMFEGFFPMQSNIDEFENPNPDTKKPSGLEKTGDEDKNPDPDVKKPSGLEKTGDEDKNPDPDVKKLSGLEEVGDESESPDPEKLSNLEEGNETFELQTINKYNTANKINKLNENAIFLAFAYFYAAQLSENPSKQNAWAQESYMRFKHANAIGMCRRLQALFPTLNLDLDENKNTYNLYREVLLESKFLEDTSLDPLGSLAKNLINKSELMPREMPWFVSEIPELIERLMEVKLHMSDLREHASSTGLTETHQSSEVLDSASNDDDMPTDTSKKTNSSTSMDSTKTPETPAQKVKKKQSQNVEQKFVKEEKLKVKKQEEKAKKDAERKERVEKEIKICEEKIIEQLLERLLQSYIDINGIASFVESIAFIKNNSADSMHTHFVATVDKGKLNRIKFETKLADKNKIPYEYLSEVTTFGEIIETDPSNSACANDPAFNPRISTNSPFIVLAFEDNFLLINLSSLPESRHHINPLDYKWLALLAGVLEKRLKIPDSSTNIAGMLHNDLLLDTLIESYATSSINNNGYDILLVTKTTIFEELMALSIKNNNIPILIKDEDGEVSIFSPVSLKISKLDSKVFDKIVFPNEKETIKLSKNATSPMIFAEIAAKKGYVEKSALEKIKIVDTLIKTGVCDKNNKRTMFEALLTKEKLYFQMLIKAEGFENAYNLLKPVSVDAQNSKYMGLGNRNSFGAYLHEDLSFENLLFILLVDKYYDESTEPSKALVASKIIDLSTSYSINVYNELDNIKNNQFAGAAAQIKTALYEDKITPPEKFQRYITYIRKNSPTASTEQLPLSSNSSSNELRMSASLSMKINDAAIPPKISDMTVNTN